jgi:hypothetical protein
LGLIGEMLVHVGRLLPVVGTFKPHVMLQIGGTFVGPAGRLTNTPAWAFTDTENATLSNAVTFPPLRAETVRYLFRCPVRRMGIGP